MFKFSFNYLNDATQQILLLDFDNLNLPFQKIIPAMFGPILSKF